MKTRQILLYENRKIDPILFDVSTLELEDRAFRWLFNYLNDEKGWNCYFDLREPEPESTDRRWIEQRRLYPLAVNGSINAIKVLLGMRKHYEYEEWTIHETREV